MMPRYQKIKEERSTRPPVGAVLTVGRKDPRTGAPRDNTRFYWFRPTPVDQEFSTRSGNKYRAKARIAHPDFRIYNSDKAPSVVTTVNAVLVHASEADAWASQYRAQTLPRHPEHPGYKPACCGDGQEATRLVRLGQEGEEEWKTLPCPGNLCEFRQGNKPACKPDGRLYFRPRWPGREGEGLPTPLAKWTTGSGISLDNCQGMFDYIRQQAAAFGLMSPNLYGIPFSMTVVRRTSATKKRAFPVVEFSVDGDLQAFFLHQSESIRQLEGRSEPAALLPGNRDPEENSPEELALDAQNYSPGHLRVPGPNGGEDEGDAESVDDGDALTLEALEQSAEEAGVDPEDYHAALSDAVDSHGLASPQELQPDHLSELAEQLNLLR